MKKRRKEGKKGRREEKKGGKKKKETPGRLGLFVLHFYNISENYLNSYQISMIKQ